MHKSFVIHRLGAEDNKPYIYSTNKSQAMADARQQVEDGIADSAVLYGLSVDYSQNPCEAFAALEAGQGEFICHFGIKVTAGEVARAGNKALQEALANNETEKVLKLLDL
ncbi:hypothetical protein [Chthonobacter albigriseus]|uniref:hypothetical protein n=1 Tax=Chthonobacter albigriseus TaxID=1683161 RepID=UPI0015EECA5D|nr:hypothetical protein [Chthonobacter albigriseus]